MRALVCTVALALAGCALRPRYNDFAGPHAGAKEVKLQVVDKDTGRPIARAGIELGDRNRYRTTADDQGIFVLPIEGKYAEENALLVVNLPGGVWGYRLVEVGAGAAPAPHAPAEAMGEDAGVISL